jgi:hypothetical protein
VALLGYSIGAYLDTIANVINDRLTPKLLALNGQKGMTDYPQLCHGAIETLDLETLGTFLTGMASAATAGMFDGEDGLDLRASLQKRAGLPIPVNPIPGVGGMGDPNQDNTGAADKPAANGKPKAQAAPPADAKPKPKDVKDQSRMAKPVNT